MRNILITGADGGLGRALVSTFSSSYSDRVFALSRGFSPKAPPVPENVTRIYGDLSSLRERYSRFLEEEDGMDVLINNAAVYISKPFFQLTTYEINHILQVNLHAPILLSHMMWSRLEKRKGIIVNINSLAGKYGAAGESLYCATKHGLSGFTKALQFDATKAGIRVVSVYCGAMRTKMSQGRKDWDKFIDPWEVAEAIYDMCEVKDSLRVTEIELMRRNY